MTKNEFLNKLENRLTALPKDDVRQRLLFYSEMIDDLCEDGKTEEQAVSEIGTIDEVVARIAEDTSLFNLVKEKAKTNRKLRGWEIILLILGFPLWFPLVLVFLTLCLVAFILLWIAAIVVYTVFISVAASSVGALVLALINVFSGNAPLAGLFICAAIACAGLTILLYYACIYVTKVFAKLTKKIGLKIKLLFIGKGKQNE